MIVVECEHEFVQSGVLAFMGTEPEFVTFRCVAGCGVEIGRPITPEELEAMKGVA